MTTHHFIRRAAPTLSRTTRLCAAMASVLVSMSLLSTIVIGFGPLLSSDAGVVTADAQKARRG